MILGEVFVPTDSGYFVSENQARIAEIIKDYDPELELVWIPPDKREPGDKPFAVVHRPVGKKEYIAFYADECDERILQRIFQGDVTRAKTTILDRIDAHNAAVKAIQLKKQMEEMEEARDITKHVLKSPKGSYTLDNGRTIHSHGPVTSPSRPKVL